MASYSYEPMLPPLAPAAFVQTVRATEEGQPVGSLTWTIPATDSGVMQILTLDVVAPHRRHGHAKRLLAEAIRQASLLQKSRKKKLRKAWMLVRQKGQVVGRSFLTGQSFHHVSTISNLMLDEDGLVYVRAFD